MFYGLKAKEIIQKSQREQFLAEHVEQVQAFKETMSEVGFNLSTAEIGKLFMDAADAGMDINTYLRARLGFKPDKGNEEDSEDSAELEKEQTGTTSRSMDLALRVD